MEALDGEGEGGGSGRLLLVRRRDVSSVEGRLGGAHR